MPEENELPDYFSLLDLPVALQVDKKLLRQRYLALSRQFHPDYFVNRPEAERQQALEASASLNKAVKILGNEEETIRYVLMRKGLLQADEKYALPQDFLMEMMELNELLSDADSDAERAAAASKITALENEIYEPVAPLIATYTEAAASEKALLQVKDYYFKKKYLQRLREQLG